MIQAGRGFSAPGRVWLLLLTLSLNSGFGFGVMRYQSHADIENGESKPLGDVFIVIQTRPDASDRRDAIRNGWLKKFVDLGADYKFSVGAGKSHSLKKSIHRWTKGESRRDDILFLPVPDEYRQTIRKRCAAARWAWEEKKDWKLYISVDGDAIPIVDTLLKIKPYLPETGLFHGNVQHSTPWRNKDDPIQAKYYISYKDWPDDHFPPFNIGPMTMFTRDTVKMLRDEHYLLQKQDHVFPLEDVAVALTLQKYGVYPWQLSSPSYVDAYTKLGWEIRGQFLNNHLDPPNPWNDYMQVGKFDRRKCTESVFAYHPFNVSSLAAVGAAEDKGGKQGILDLICAKNPARSDDCAAYWPCYGNTLPPEE